MDPEDLRDVIASFQNRCSAVIRRYDGFVAKYMGDGILVYFGYPRAHEDEAERSVRAKDWAEPADCTQFRKILSGA